MTKKLTRHGNSMALIIDKPLLQMLNITEETNLELFINNDSLVIRPVAKKSRRAKSNKEIREIAQEIMDEYSDVFKKLAQ